MRRLLIIVGLLVVVPIIEIAVLIAIGQVIGAAWTILLVLATSALGGWLLRREGGRAWRAFQTDLAEGRPPGNTATDGLLVLIGGIFMLVPGFVSDVIGGLLILPPTRRVARALVLRTFSHRISPAAATSLFGPRRVRARYGQPHPAAEQDVRQGAPGTAQGPGENGGEAIEGEIIDPR
jgi:UPF0716 protein FxsA